MWFIVGDICGLKDVVIMVKEFRVLNIVLFFYFFLNCCLFIVIEL